MTRFMIRLGPLWRATLLPFGATRTAAFVDVSDSSLRFKFGFGFDRTIARDQIVSAYRRPWPWWMGVGWRSNLRGVIGLIGSYEGVAEVKLREKTRAWGVFPCDRIAVSLEDPDGFVAALGGDRRGGAVPREETPAEAPKKTTTRRSTSSRSRRKPKSS